MTGVLITLALAWGGDAPLVFLDFGERPRRAEILRVLPADAPSWSGQRAKGSSTVLVEDALRPVLFGRRGDVGVDLDGDGTIRPDETTRGSREGQTWTAVLTGGGYRLDLAWTDTRLTQQEQRHQATLALAGTPVSVLAHTRDGRLDQATLSLDGETTTTPLLGRHALNQAWWCLSLTSEAVLSARACDPTGGTPSALPAVPDRAGTLHRTEDYDDGILIVDFWGSWCKPCVADHPSLLALAEDPRVRVVGVAVDLPHKLEAYLRKHPLPWPTILAGEPGAKAVPGVDGYPTYHVYDHGVLVMVARRVAPIAQWLEANHSRQ